LKIVAGKSPRNLRRHGARILLCDEVDAILASAEGDPVSLAEKRTLSFSRSGQGASAALPARANG
jgi:phage terminase large subunit GpA-like protein